MEHQIDVKSAQQNVRKLEEKLTELKRRENMRKKIQNDLLGKTLSAQIKMKANSKEKSMQSTSLHLPDNNKIFSCDSCSRTYADSFKSNQRKFRF